MNKKLKKTICIATLITVIGCSNAKYIRKGMTYLANQEKFDETDKIKDIIINVYNNNEISKLNNIYATFGYFSALIQSGCININDEHERDENAVFHDYYGYWSYDAFTNKVVCRHENSLIAECLNLVGFDAMPIGATPISEGENHVYVLLFDHDKNNKAIGDSYNNCFWKIEGTDKTEAIKCYINNNSIYLTNSGYTNNPALLESLLTNPEFQSSDLIKFMSYDNANYEEIYSYYNIGIKAFKESNDKESIKEATLNIKNKIKELEK